MIVALNAEERAYNDAELMAVLLSREVRNDEISACGALSMIPAAGLLLAQATHAPDAELIILGSPFTPFKTSRQFHYLAQRGDLDVGLAVLGDLDERPAVRGPHAAETDHADPDRVLRSQRGTHVRLGNRPIGRGAGADNEACTGQRGGLGEEVAPRAAGAERAESAARPRGSDPARPRPRAPGGRRA